MNSAIGTDSATVPAVAPATDELLTPKQVAEHLGCARRTVYKMLDEHAFDRVIRRGERFIRIPRSAVDRFIAEHTEVLR